jgi:hypothetical protein
MLHDPGAYPEGPLDGRITWRIREPYREPRDDEERRNRQKAEELIERIRKSVEAKRHDASGPDSQAT